MRARVFAAAVLVLALAPGEKAADRTAGISAVAVFPVENLTGVGIPAQEIGEFIAGELEGAGVEVLPQATIADFITRHRLRYAAGLDPDTASALRNETGADAVVFVSVDLSNDAEPPKFGLTARITTTEPVPTVVWAHDRASSGDDAPGLLDLGMIRDFPALLGRELERLADALVGRLRDGREPEVKRDDKFRPRVAYRQIALDPGRTYSVAVLPFYNVGDRRGAGEILALLFARHLSAVDAFSVIDPGTVRQQLLQARIIMDGGISITDADLVASLVDADFVLAGRVLHYRDYEGSEGLTRVDFSTVLIEKASRRVVWSSHSYNDGGDGVLFFGRGRSTTAHAMASQMVRRATEWMATGRR